jgi:hypothetical protein
MVNDRSAVQVPVQYVLRNPFDGPCHDCFDVKASRGTAQVPGLPDGAGAFGVKRACFSLHAGSVPLQKV